MAIRFDSNADFLNRSATNITTTSQNLSICMWVKRKVDTNAFATALYASTGGSTNNHLELFIECEAGGDRLDVYELPGTESQLIGPTLTIDTWFFIGYRRTNTARKMYWGTEAGGVLSSSVNSDTRNVNQDFTTLRIGNDVFSEPFNGEIAYVRLWQAELTDAEFDAEWRSTVPVRSGVRGDWRLASVATAGTDSSGNNLTLTANGTLTLATNPTPPAAATPVGITRTATWDVRTRAAITRAASWSVRNPAAITRAATWNARATALLQRTATWRVGARRRLTFEAGSLTGADAFDAVFGTGLAVVADGVLRGSNLVDVPNLAATNHGSVSTMLGAGVGQVHVSKYVVLDAASNAARVVRLVGAGGTIGSLVFNFNRTVQLQDGTSTVGSSATALTLGTVYRLGLRYVKGTGANAVLEGYLAVGDDEFGAPFASTTTSTRTDDVTEVQFGPTNANAADYRFDEIVVDTEALPGPTVEMEQVGVALVVTWDARSPAAAARTATWDTRGLAATQRVATWNALAAATAQRMASWDVRSPALLQQVASWDVRSLALLQRTVRWDARSLAAAGWPASWDARAAAAIQRTASWSVLAATGTTWSATWTTLVVAGAAWSVSWSARELVDGSWTAAWDLHEPAAAQWSTTWDVFELAAAAWVASWDVEAPAGVVGRTWAATWGARELAAENWAAAWNVLEATGQASWSASWSTRGLVDGSWTASWDVLPAPGAVASSWQVTWNVRAVAAEEWTAAWDVLELSARSLPSSWDVLVASGQAGWTTTWDARAVAAGSWPATWDVVGRAASSWRATWAIDVFPLRLVAGLHVDRFEGTAANRQLVGAVVRRALEGEVS